MNQDLNANFAMRGFLGALNWTPHWYQPEGPYSAQEVTRHIAEYAVAGLPIRNNNG